MFARGPRATAVAALVAGALVASGCATQPDYRPPALAAPAAWSAAVPLPDAAAAFPGDRWWTLLDDSAINELVDHAMADSPSVAQAVARVDEARASLGSDAAQRLPAISLDGTATRARSLGTSAATSATTLETTASAGLGLSWEIDLFGRVRKSVEAARHRLDARTADAAAARLSLAAQVANSVLALRACDFSRTVATEDIRSRESVLALTRRRVATGFVAPVDEARAQSGLAAVRTSLALRNESCARIVNGLSALTGRDAAQVRSAVPAAGTAAVMPVAPPVALALPAAVLAAHPAVVAAEREVAASWEQIAVARAERLPRFDLAAAISGQWLRAGGSTLDFTTWALTPTLSAPLFDGGAGAAQVEGAQARHRVAAATLRAVLRTTSQEVENALAAVASSRERIVSTRESTDAAARTLAATEAQWRAGAVSLFELEDARRQQSAAQDSAITAAHDAAQAWVALVRAAGPTAITTESHAHVLSRLSAR